MYVVAEGAREVATVYDCHTALSSATLYRNTADAQAVVESTATTTGTRAITTKTTTDGGGGGGPPSSTNSGDGLSAEAKIGLGVGLATGIPTILIALLTWCCPRARQQERYFRSSSDVLWGSFDELRSCSSGDVWFIVDRPHLCQSFQGLTHLLAFDPQQTHGVSDFLDFLRLEDRFLSVAAAGSVDVSGVTRKHRGYLNALRSKAHIIASLPTFSIAKGSIHDRQYEIFRAIRSADVFEAAQVIVQWSARFPDGSEICGRVVSGRVKIVYENSQISRQGVPRQPLPAPRAHRRDDRTLANSRDRQGLTSPASPHGVERSGFDLVLEGQGILVRIFEETESAVVGQASTDIDNGGLLPHHERELGQAAQDKMRLFLAEIEHLKSIEGLMDRSWMATQTDRLFSRICRIDDQDPALFLPTEALDRYRRCGLGLPDEKATVVVPVIPGKQS
ncbi:hypothetical protein MFIFM68171_01559 [Madurella fahalii]|uniref:Uncharacterized protein n=1 Tax=Madurella fahalii TaxID=1157608 RepID=A0ABQ0G0U0_9PEZI